ncbi:MAG: Rrf2 family transcriptional regulator [Phenylobacterium sp.]|jgi:Rrf2 family transcriptional regulator, iron-sulfur cluster assembly transcription factor|uniref:Rrf2 family transcriptional regulator n=1 Tax=Phenylobacterium sp. TaxID=1871053 RepID=UPI00391A26BE
MRLSTKGRYAVMAMADLARREGALGEGDRAVALAEIAARQQISLSYLEQLFARLRRRGLVVSARGPGGGYRLAREAEATSIAEIVLAVDEPLRATRCSAKSKGCMLKGERCLTHDLWEEMGRHLQSYLASVSLADVVSGRLARPEPQAEVA